MALNKNYETHPNNFFAPETITVDESEYDKYLVRFNNLYELYDFLKSKHVINTRVFPELASIEGSYEFAGIPYPDAVEDLINFEEVGYNEFLELITALIDARVGVKHQYKVLRTPAGGHLNVQAYSTGSPLCYESYERVKRPKFIKVHSTLSYLSYTTKQQVLNKAIILISVINALEKNGYRVQLNTFELSDKKSVINALEKNGYRVQLNTFELSDKNDELIHIVVNAKDYNDKINLQTLYKTNCHVEFLRRILFRILEASAVTNSWGNGYGHTCSEKFAKKVLNISDKDIYFGTPSELGIEGEDLAEDFDTCLNKLNLQNKFDIQEISDEFKEKIKRMIK